MRESEQTTSAPVDRDREDDRADGRADGRADDAERTERSSGVNVVGMTDNIETVRETGRSGAWGACVISRFSMCTRLSFANWTTESVVPSF